ncbi:50S ribosomal protein L25/general stress protein Ctc [Flaviflexus huanghaiensis]|uniref:50S ribosomal protein L25/general stress protein Ctc n=1 Tax=Flaviflexus huanghaiensis TaxID=1111473 RepID=UPI0015F7CAE2|nr:50S ribosomal protein L25/general stress protein Ctc [Flaviflexus huanghaiensis]
MVDSVKLTNTVREDFGKGAARRLRRAGQIPAVIYGHGAETIHIALDAHETFLAVRYNQNALVTVTVNGKDQLALVRDIQRHPMTWDIEHIDLIGVRAGEQIEVTVPITVVGEPAPGTVVTTDLLTVTIMADATMIPESIEVDVEGKEAGTQVRIADLALGEGVSTEMDPEDLVVSVLVPQVDTSLEEADAEAAEEAAGESGAEKSSEGAEEDSE